MMRSPLSKLFGWSSLSLSYFATRRMRRLLAEGHTRLDAGDPGGASACSMKALRLNTSSSAAHELLAHALMPGPDYYSVLSLLHQILEPHSYVEIGVRNGESLCLALSGTTTIGIDPFPQMTERVHPGTRLYPMTSDEFFENLDLHEELGTATLSLAFIDGMHLFEQVLKDFMNLERYAGEETVVVVHDCMPLTRRVASRDRQTGFWCGDGWKIVPCLLSYRPDLRIAVVPTKPSGLGIISNLDPTSTVLADGLDQICREYEPRELDYDPLDIRGFQLCGMTPPMLPNVREQIVVYLASRKETAEPS